MPASNSEENAYTQPQATHIPDHVGDGLADDAYIWRLYHQVATEADKNLVDGWNRGLDTLALFAGLFSAVTTAFIVESYKLMQPDFTELTFRALTANASSRSSFDEPFRIPPAARVVNVLWISSLLLSLSAALLAIMGKDWIAAYPTPPMDNLRQWAELRQHRLDSATRWHMPAVIASAPVLLHISLLLFAAGLVGFLSPIDVVTTSLTACLLAVAVGLYAATALSPVIWTSSPFRSPSTPMVRKAVHVLQHLRFVHGILRVGHKVDADGRRAFQQLGVGLHRWTRRLLVWAKSPPSAADTDLPRANSSPPAVTLSAAVSTLRSAALALRRSLSARLSRSSAHREILSAVALSDAAHEPSTLEMVVRSTVAHASSDTVSGVPHSEHARSLSLSPGPDVQQHAHADLWRDPHENPVPRRIARTLSWLSTAAPTLDVLRAIMASLSDAILGDQVVPVLSAGLTARIVAEMAAADPAQLTSRELVLYFLAGIYLLIDVLPGDRHPSHKYLKYLDVLDLRTRLTALSTCPDGILIHWVLRQSKGPNDIEYYGLMKRLCERTQIRRSTLDKMLQLASTRVTATSPLDLRLQLPRVLFVLDNWTRRPHCDGDPEIVVNLLLCFLSSSYRSIYEARARDTQHNSDRDTTAGVKYCNVVELLCVIMTRRISIDNSALEWASRVLLFFLQLHRQDGQHLCLAEVFGNDYYMGIPPAWIDGTWTASDVWSILRLLPCPPADSIGTWNPKMTYMFTKGRWSLPLLRITRVLLSPEQTWYTAGRDHYSYNSLLDWCSLTFIGVLRTLSDGDGFQSLLVDVVRRILERAGLMALAGHGLFAMLLAEIGELCLRLPDPEDYETRVIVRWLIASDGPEPKQLDRRWRLAEWIGMCPDNAYGLHISGDENRGARNLLNIITDLHTCFPNEIDWEDFARTVHEKWQENVGVRPRYIPPSSYEELDKSFDQFVRDMGFSVQVHEQSVQAKPGRDDDAASTALCQWV